MQVRNSSRRVKLIQGCQDDWHQRTREALTLHLTVSFEREQSRVRPFRQATPAARSESRATHTLAFSAIVPSAPVTMGSKQQSYGFVLHHVICRAVLEVGDLARNFSLRASVTVWMQRFTEVSSLFDDRQYQIMRSRFYPLTVCGRRPTAGVEAPS